MGSLVLAAILGNPAEVSRQLEAGASLDEAGWDGRTALHAAAFEGNADVVRLLLDAGAFIGARDWERATPLHLAASEGHATVSSMLLEAGANLEARDAVQPKRPKLLKEPRWAEEKSLELTKQQLRMTHQLQEVLESEKRRRPGIRISQGRWVIGMVDKASDEADDRLTKYTIEDHTSAPLAGAQGDFRNVWRATRPRGELDMLSPSVAQRRRTTEIKITPSIQQTKQISSDTRMTKELELLRTKHLVSGSAKYAGLRTPPSSPSPTPLKPSNSPPSGSQSARSMECASDWSLEVAALRMDPTNLQKLALDVLPSTRRPPPCPRKPEAERQLDALQAPDVQDGPSTTSACFPAAEEADLAQPKLAEGPLQEYLNMFNKARRRRSIGQVAAAAREASLQGTGNTPAGARSAAASEVALVEPPQVQPPNSAADPEGRGSRLPGGEQRNQECVDEVSRNSAAPLLQLPSAAATGSLMLTAVSQLDSQRHDLSKPSIGSQKQVPAEELELLRDRSVVNAAKQSLLRRSQDMPAVKVDIGQLGTASSPTRKDHGINTTWNQTPAKAGGMWACCTLQAGGLWACRTLQAGGLWACCTLQAGGLWACCALQAGGMWRVARCAGGRPGGCTLQAGGQGAGGMVGVLQLQAGGLWACCTLHGGMYACTLQAGWLVGVLHAAGGRHVGVPYAAAAACGRVAALRCRRAACGVLHAAGGRLVGVLHAAGGRHVGVLACCRRAACGRVARLQAGGLWAPLHAAGGRLVAVARCMAGLWAAAKAWRLGLLTAGGRAGGLWACRTLQAGGLWACCTLQAGGLWACCTLQAGGLWACHTLQAGGLWACCTLQAGGMRAACGVLHAAGGRLVGVLHAAGVAACGRVARCRRAACGEPHAAGGRLVACRTLQAGGCGRVARLQAGGMWAVLHARRRAVCGRVARCAAGGQAVARPQAWRPGWLQRLQAGWPGVLHAAGGRLVGARCTPVAGGLWACCTLQAGGLWACRAAGGEARACCTLQAGGQGALHAAGGRLGVSHAAGGRLVGLLHAAGGRFVGVLHAAGDGLWACHTLQAGWLVGVLHAAGGRLVGVGGRPGVLHACARRLVGCCTLQAGGLWACRTLQAGGLWACCTLQAGGLWACCTLQAGGLWACCTLQAGGFCGDTVQNDIGRLQEGATPFQTPTGPASTPGKNASDGDRACEETASRSSAGTYTTASSESDLSEAGMANEPQADNGKAGNSEESKSDTKQTPPLRFLLPVDQIGAGLDGAVSTYRRKRSAMPLARGSFGIGEQHIAENTESRMVWESQLERFLNDGRSNHTTQGSTQRTLGTPEKDSSYINQRRPSWRT
ncbi:hypothetical protein CYMTET_39284 [Cymbomonas tetramitiformis]|uniref:Uncharacterized protein n=1 Tax=Cymbomonas tetramitiformis TaxID=36881 RepID=A0AAE0F5R1_9CHLO|nr:hypothetical protein CYMTET_39284 [Cymbomonas tetramitiformis]